MATLFESAVKGYNAADDIIKENRAYQEARKIYGDGKASDPGLFSALEGMEQAQNQDRRADEQLELNKRGADRQDRGADRADRADSRQAETHVDSMQAKNDKRREEGILNVVQGLRQARDNGEDVGEAFDAMAEMLPNLGVSAEDIPAMREQLVENPEMLDAYYASLTDAGEQATEIKNRKAGGLTGAASGATTGQESVSRTVGDMRKLYTELDELGGMRNTDSGFVSGIGRAASGSMVGRALANSGLATKDMKREESLRRSIEGLRPSLITAMKSAEEMGAKMFDSARDMEIWLSTVSDPTQDLQTVTRLLDEFEAKYGIAANGGVPVPIKAQATIDNPSYQRTNGSDMDTIYPGFKAPNGAVFNGGKPGDPLNWTQPGASP